MRLAHNPAMDRRRLRVQGVVQGVGFRPFVYALARRHELAGFVLNDGTGVLIEVEGPGPALDSFAQALLGEAPPLARIDGVSSQRISLTGDAAFATAASMPSRGGALVPAD